MCSQLTDARVLRDNTHRRGDNVQGALRKLLADELVTDYVYYINMKQKLLVDAKEIEVRSLVIHTIYSSDQTILHL